LERKQQRAEASKALESKNVNLQEVARQAGSLGRRIEREVRRFEATGRVSNWLAGETSKAEAAQAAAQQSGFNPPRSQPLSNTNVPLAPIPLSPSNYVPPRPLDLKPDITPPTPITGQGQGTCIGLNLYIKTVNDSVQVWIGAGTVAGDLPSDFDPAEGKSIAGSGSGNVWAEVNINGTTGNITSVAVEGGGTTPDDTDTSFHYALGYYEYVNGAPTVTNYGCGSVSTAICRNWFRTTSPFYTVTFLRN
jgi:hypothetical protein